MKLAKNKTAIAIALVLMFTMATSVIVAPAVQAQLIVDIPTKLLISVSPNPVGAGQVAYVNTFFAQPTPTTAGEAGDRYEGVTVEVVRPDGTKETFGPYMADSTGGMYLSYTPSTTGNYTFQSVYPGQVMTGTNPLRLDPSGARAKHLIGKKLLPTKSEILTLVVQEEPIGPIYKTSPLPTEYWTRPIYATNWGWAQLGGNWHGVANVVKGVYSASNVQLYSTAPNTGHILWTKPTKFGGQPGAPYDSDQQSQYMSTSLLDQYFRPSGVLNGILYYNEYISANSQVGNWIAVDLRTGETLWTRTAGQTGSETIAAVQTIQWHSIQEYGAWPFLWTFSASTFRIYDAMTGTYLHNITNAQNVLHLMDFDCNEKGTFLGWYTTSNATGTYLNKWNSTQCILYYLGRGPFYGPGGGWRSQSTYGWQSNVSFSMGLEWTVKLDTGVPTSIAARTPEYILFRDAPTHEMFVSQGLGYQVTACYDAVTGAKLWGPLNQTLPQGESIGFTTYGKDVYVLTSKTLLAAWGYSLKTGKLLWGPVDMPGSAWSHLAITGASDRDTAYIIDFGGYVNAIDLQTGKIKWTYTRGSAGYDTPFGVYPLWYFTYGTISDGKLFLKEGHEYNPPLFPSRLLCLNATTGELIWSTLFCGVKSPAAIADGMMVTWNSLDSQIYTFGKGPTATTVAASPKASVHGSSVLVEGMVTDESPGTKEYALTARFPNGVPAVSDDSMSPWMEYVYMQQSRPGNAKGVEVTLDTIDPNGNFVHIGTVTSDASGMYKKAFVPEVPGEYTIIATFAGSESYWPSYAETAINVEEAAPATPPPEYPVPVDTTLTIIAATIAIIIAVAIVGILMLRKRP